MDLQDTIEMMLSDNYKERFKAEYYQTKIRYDKLQDMVDNWAHLDFEPILAREIYLLQLKIMKAYLVLLEFRAKAEKIEL